jgi:hypothetical protein
VCVLFLFPYLRRVVCAHPAEHLRVDPEDKWQRSCNLCAIQLVQCALRLPRHAAALHAPGSIRSATRNLLRLNPIPLSSLIAVMASEEL